MFQKERIYMSNGMLQFCTCTIGCDKCKPFLSTTVTWAKFNQKEFRFKQVWKKGKKPSQIVKEHKADYGLNFSFVWRNKPVADYVQGDQILNKGYDEVGGVQQTRWFGVKIVDGKLTIGQFPVAELQGEDSLTKTTPLLLNSGGREVWDYYRVQDGTAEDIGKKGNVYIRAQRTFIGLTENDEDVIIAIADGRSVNNSAGLNLQEMAKFMAAKGAVRALNGDGGDSSIVVDKNGQVLNSLRVDERTLEHSLMIYDMREPEVELPPLPEKPQELYLVQVGAYANKETAQKLIEQLNELGYPTLLKREER